MDGVTIAVEMFQGMAHTVHEKYERVFSHVVEGAEVHVPFFGSAIDLTNRGPQVRLGPSSDKEPGASVSMGVEFSPPASGEESGTITIAAGAGGQLGWAVNNGEARITDIRLVLGLAAKLSFSGGVDIPETPDVKRPGTLEAQADATAVAH